VQQRLALLIEIAVGCIFAVNALRRRNSVGRSVQRGRWYSKGFGDTPQDGARRWAVRRGGLTAGVHVE